MKVPALMMSTDRDKFTTGGTTAPVERAFRRGEPKQRIAGRPGRDSLEPACDNVTTGGVRHLSTAPGGTDKIARDHQLRLSMITPS